MKTVVRVLSLLLAAMLVLSCGSGVLAQEGRVEGEGFSSPEEALLAYAEALKAGDIDGMLSTFCVETYCENFNTDAFLERMGMVNTSMSLYVPANGDPFLARLNRETRQDEIVDNIVRQFRMVALLGTEYQDLSLGTPLIIDESGTAALLGLLSDTTPFSTMSIGDIVTLEALTGRGMEDEVMVTASQNTLARTGADELACSAVRLRIMGEDWLLMMDAVRYGDKWYNMNSMGTLALFCNLNVLTGGLAPESELN